jgi:hypothetical protein
MSHQSQPPSPREALIAFDQARDAFLAAFARAPDEALSFVPAGDEYAVGVLLSHLRDPLRDYMALCAAMLSGDFAPVDNRRDASGAAADARHHAALAALRPTGADRARLLGELAQAHQQVHTRISSLDDATFNRQALITFSAGSAASPTAARDIMGWLTDHYREHTEQVGTMLEEWRR